MYGNLQISPQRKAGFDLTLHFYCLFLVIGQSQASTSTARLLPGAGSAIRAIDVSELPVLSKVNLKASAEPFHIADLELISLQNKLKDSEVGKAMVYSETFAKKILDDALPRKLRKDLALTQRPTTVLRKATVAIVKDLKDGKQLKVVVGGKTGTGRSTVLLQTIASCQDSGWPVLHIPDGAFQPFSLREDNW